MWESQIFLWKSDRSFKKFKKCDNNSDGCKKKNVGNNFQNQEIARKKICTSKKSEKKTFRKKKKLQKISRCQKNGGKIVKTKKLPEIKSGQ